MGILCQTLSSKEPKKGSLGQQQKPVLKESSDEEEEQKRECSSEEERTAIPKYFNESVPALCQQQRTKKRLQRTAAKASTGEHPASTFRVSSPAEKGGLKDGTEKSGVQVLEDVQEQQLIQGRAVPVALGWVHTVYQKLTAATEKYVYLVEERNKNWKAQCAALRKQVLNYKTERGKREDTVRQLQQELAAALKKLSVAEGSLEESTRRCRTLEEANLGLRKELREAEEKDTVRQLQQELAAALKKLSVAEGSLEESTRRCRTLEEANLGLRKELRKAKTKCQELEKQQLHYEHHIQYWMSTLKDRDRELKDKSQQVQDLLSFSLETRARVKQLEQRVQCLSMQNIRLEGTVKQQRSWIEALRGDVEASASKRAEEMPATSFTVPSDCGGHFEHWCWV
ncbi:putative ankyrin repeat domain-containing protein 20A12 pseudogene [Calypte anna]|uniref:putative ankyrin repeat domain-containing protein 20A12 pseudogene n=1 Tax=Calypte anna TaxID=9244 RepID=UPI0011C49487|nr:putative ankyrin repeat domain-containing protein 20A12 pseudogene [Calypte anna]